MVNLSEQLYAHEDAGPGHGYGRCAGHHLPVQLPCLCGWRVALPQGATGRRVQPA